jgi:hypothetical protein
MGINFKDLISRAEYLGVDTQILRDLYADIQNGKIELSPYLHTLQTLKVQMSKPFGPGSQPLAISLLLKQLTRKFEAKAEATSQNYNSVDVEDLKLLLQDTLKAAQGQKDMTNSEILHAVKSLSQEVKQIKTQSAAPQIQDPAVEMESVFVDPMEEDKEIKANVSIESEKGSSIQSKLDKLKKLKNGN